MKIAIQGHPIRGHEVIQILESLGGKNIDKLEGTYETFYYINDKSEICDDHKKNFPLTYKLYTLKEFEKEFPFKVGDKVKHITSIGIIKEYCYIDNEPAYKVKSIELGVIATIPVKILEPYKEMEKRNITLALDKAKEWYKKGGELKEIALQAYSEEELTKVDLPKTWEEFCNNYPLKKGECWLGNCDAIHEQALSEERTFRNWIPSKKSAEAHLVLIQLEQLRDCWRQGWVQTPINTGYRIGKALTGDYVVTPVVSFKYFLAFPTEEMAHEFLKCFRDLIKKAGELI